MDGRIYSPEKGKFVSLKTKHGQKVLKNYNEHRVGGDKHQNCAYCKIVNPQTGKLVSTYGQTGGRVIRDYVKQEGGAGKARNIHLYNFTIGDKIRQRLNEHDKRMSEKAGVDLSSIQIWKHHQKWGETLQNGKKWTFNEYLTNHDKNMRDSLNKKQKLKEKLEENERKRAKNIRCAKRKKYTDEVERRNKLVYNAIRERQKLFNKYMDQGLSPADAHNKAKQEFEKATDNVIEVAREVAKEAANSKSETINMIDCILFDVETKYSSNIESFAKKVKNGNITKEEFREKLEGLYKKYQNKPLYPNKHPHPPSYLPLPPPRHLAPASTSIELKKFKNYNKIKPYSVDDINFFLKQHNIQKSPETIEYFSALLQERS